MGIECPARESIVHHKSGVNGRRVWDWYGVPAAAARVFADSVVVTTA
jgi:hypothetical protein